MAGAGGVSRGTRGTRHEARVFPLGVISTACHRLGGMRLNLELIKYGVPAPPPDILP